MDIVSVLLGYILAAVKKNKATEKVTSDIMSPLNKKIIAFWEKIKPNFFKEDETLIDKIESNPDDKNTQAELKSKLSEKLEDKNFQLIALKMIKEIQKLEQKKTSNITIHKRIDNKGNRNTNIIN